MSMAYCKAAWNAAVPGARKIVLLALADVARDDDDGLCWPSVATLTKLCGTSERSIQAHLNWLEAGGFVTRVFRQGSRTRYQLTDPSKWPQVAWSATDSTSADLAPRQELPPAECAEDPRKSCAEPPQILHSPPADLAPIKATLTSSLKSNQENKPIPLAPSPPEDASESKSAKPKKPPRRNDRSDDAAAAGWAEFWSAYPRSDGKKAALKAWTKIGPDAELQARILAAIALLRDSEGWRKDGGRFIPHATTWLNGERWTDVDHKPGSIATVPRNRREQLRQALANAKTAAERIEIYGQLHALSDEDGDAIEGTFRPVPVGPGYLPRDPRSDEEVLAEMEAAERRMRGEPLELAP